MTDKEFVRAKMREIGMMGVTLAIIMGRNPSTISRMLSDGSKTKYAYAKVDRAVYPIIEMWGLISEKARKRMLDGEHFPPEE